MKTGYLCRKPVTSAIWRLLYARDFGKLAAAEITGVRQLGCRRTVMSRYFGRRMPKSLNNDKSLVYGVTTSRATKRFGRQLEIAAWKFWDSYFFFNSSNLTKMKKQIPDIPLPQNLQGRSNWWMNLQLCFNSMIFVNMLNLG